MHSVEIYLTLYLIPCLDDKIIAANDEPHKASKWS